MVVIPLKITLIPGRLPKNLSAKLAADAGVPEMWLTHYSPSMTHPENHLDDLKKIFPGTVIGKDGMSAELNFEED